MTTPTTVQARFQLRADTAANWTSVNPTLLNNEFGLETDTKKLKVGNGSTAWNSLAYFPSIVSGGTVLGNLEIGTTGTLTFEGSTADGFETTLAVTNPTADRTITLPNQSGTVVVSGNASIVDADIAANAEIAVSKLADGAARQLLQTDAAGTGVEWTDNVDIPGTLDVTGAATFDGAVTIAGDLTVNGTTTNINTQNLVVEDKNVILGDVATPTDVTADGGGITLKGTTDKTLNWVDATNAWTSSEYLDLPAGTAANPSLFFGGDVNSGLYSPGADQVAISTAGTGRLFIDSSGRLGIGTNSPVATVHSVGTSTAPSFLASGSAQDFCAPDGEALQIGHWNSGTTTMTTRIHISSAGNVGVGTTSPALPFEISYANATNYGLRIGNTDTTSTARSGLDLRLSSGSAGGNFYVDSAVTGGSPYDLHIRRGQGSASICFDSNIGEHARIDSLGRLLVGTSSTSATTNALFHGSAGADQGLILLARRSDPGTTSQIGAINFSGSDHIGTAQISCNRDSGTWTAGTSLPSRLSFLTTADGSATATERLRITSAGLVGIGTSSPDQMLHLSNSSGPVLRFENTDTTIVAGDSFGSIEFESNDASASSGVVAKIEGFAHTTMDGSTVNGGAIRFSTATVNPVTLTERLRIDSSGRVGVGTTSPITSFHVNSGTTDLAAIVESSDANVFLAFKDGNSSGNQQVQIGAVTNDLVAYAGGSERARIDSSGRLGVGTASPGAILHLAGSNSTSTSDTPAATIRLEDTDASTAAEQPIGKIEFYGNDSTVPSVGPQAYILSKAAGTSGGGDLRFGTCTSTAATESARIDSAGRLLVGTSSNIRGSKLQVLSTGNDHQSLVGGNQIAQFELCRSSDSAGGAGVVADGNVIGRIEYLGNDGSAYRSAGRIEAVVDGTPGTNDMPGRLVFSTTADGASTPTERMSILASGNICANSSTRSNIASSAGTNGGFKFVANTTDTTVCCEGFTASTSTRYHISFTNPNGVVGSISTSASATAYNTSSDYRLKENVTAVTDGVTRLQQLKPSRFNFIADPAKTVDGFLAHEVQDVVPEAITGEKDAVDADGNPQYQGIDQSKLVPLLTAALQEAVAKIESLEARLTAAGL